MSEQKDTDTWLPTTELRFRYFAARGHILQQKWMNAAGESEWKDVPIYNPYISDTAKSEDKEKPNG